MGKDKAGKFQPGKGKPSGINKGEGLVINPTPPEHTKQFNEITENYTEGEDELSPNAIRHPNRNTRKGDNTKEGKVNIPGSDRSVSDALFEDVTSLTAQELPGLLTKEIFKELATHGSSCCISIFLDMHKAGVEVNEHYDHTRIKNALQAAARILKEKNIEEAEIEKLLGPGFELLGNDEFRMQPSQGLAFFVSEGYFKYIKMPLDTTPDIVIDNTFYVTPLIPIMVSNEYFYLLVISKKQTKLFRGNAFGMEYIPVEGVPTGLEEEIGDTDISTTSGTGGRNGTGAANFHGIGGGNNNYDKAYIANYLESVDDVIWKQVLHDENAPLLLAGVEYLIPIYRSVSDYKYLYEDALTGSHEYDDIPVLYKQARKKMEPYFQERVNKALENYGNLSATELASSVIDEIIPAAYYARVSNLFVQKGGHIRGTFNEMTSELNITDQNTEGSQELIDNAVVKTLLSGGEVFLLEPDNMPAASKLAAIFRY